MRESVTVNHLKRVLFKKSYEQIEDLMSLYTVMKEERIALSTFYNDKEYTFDELQAISLDEIKNLSPKQTTYLANLRERKEVLSQRFLKEDL